MAKFDVDDLVQMTKAQAAKDRARYRAPDEGEGVPLGSFKKGGTVPKTGTYKLHKGEKVIPAKVVAKPAPAKQYVGESHSYDSNRPKKPQRSRYNGAAGAAY